MATRPQDVRIKLTEAEMTMAALAGVQRGVFAIYNEVKPRYGAGNGESWQKNIEGAMGEFACSKVMNMFWSGKGEIGQIDIGNDSRGCEVRTTKYNDGKLMLHPDDDDDKVFALMTGSYGLYTYRGWILAKDGKQQEFVDELQPGRPAFCVPQSALKL